VGSCLHEMCFQRGDALVMSKFFTSKPRLTTGLLLSVVEWDLSILCCAEQTQIDLSFVLSSIVLHVLLFFKRVGLTPFAKVVLETGFFVVQYA